MFSQGLSSVLGNYASTEKKHFGADGHDDEWYIPYNGPYEAPPRDTTVWKRMQRDSWGDPIPLRFNDDKLDLSENGDVEEKICSHSQTGLQVDFMGGAKIKYGAHGVFDDDRNSAAGIGRYSGAFKERERAKTAYRRSTVSTGGSHGIPEYVSSDRVSGGVGESPVPHRRASKDARRISLASIFTFGAKMRSGSPARSFGSSREKRRDSPDSTSRRSRQSSSALKEMDQANRRQHPTPTNVSLLNFTTKKREQCSNVDGTISLADDDHYHNYYNTFYSMLESDDVDAETKRHPYLTGRQVIRTIQQYQKCPQEVQQPPSSLDVLQHGEPDHGLSRAPRQNSREGHPYAWPYSHQNRVDDGQVVEGRIPLTSPSPPVATVQYPPVFQHQRHPYNQTQSGYTRHAYGQNSISTGASSPSHQSNSPKSPELMTSDVEGVEIGLRTRPTEKKLKNSISTPDLRSSQVVDYATRFSKSFRQAPPPVLVPHQPRPLPKGKDRWLSAETWCDALLFPRPRLKIKHDEISSEQLVEDPVAAEGSLVLPIRRGSNRIVSPPGSPLGGEWDVEILNGVETQILDNQQLSRDRSCVGSGSSHEQKQREPGVASRVLAHSRSLIDLGQRHRMGMEMQRARILNELPAEINAVDGKVAAQHRQPLIAEEGPSKFVRGEFAFPTPAPSLDHVLAEGRLLEEERQAWQVLAINSFGNKHARSLSRTRAKSLTQSGRATMKRIADRGAGELPDRGTQRRGGHHHQSSIEYLAAQACLGNQNVAMTPSASVPNLVWQTHEPDGSVPDASKTTHPMPTRVGATAGVLSKYDPGQESHAHPNSNLTRTLNGNQNNSQIKNSKTNSSNHSAGSQLGRLCGNPGLDVDLDLNLAERMKLLGNSGSRPRSATDRIAPDLEGALKRRGTKVIRLADPAYIPVDKRLPMSLSTSPMGKEARIKAPITPPYEARDSETAIGLNALMPTGTSPAANARTHPYAQGGVPFGQMAGKSAIVRHIEPHDFHSPIIPPSSSASKAIPSIPPSYEPPTHPYASAVVKSRRRATSLIRDSYLNSNGLVAQYRSQDGKPHPSKMWAQLSPGVLREILPDDIQYSPYISETIGVEGTNVGYQRPWHGNAEERVKSIHDTAGVAEALIHAEMHGTTQTTGFVGMDDDHKAPLHPNQDNLLRSETLLPVVFENVSDPPVEHTIACSHSRLSCRSESASSSLTSEGSPPQSRPLGSPSDLESFRDLFYRSDANSDSRKPREISLSDTPHTPNPGMSWGVAIQNRRTGSSLTSLARQLDQEYEAFVSLVDSTPSRSRPLGAPHHSDPSSLWTGDNLQFVLEEMPRAESPAETNPGRSIHVFQSEISLSEDIQSLQASSINENVEEDDTAMMRLGMVESASTPPVINPGHRSSFNCETVFGHDGENGNDNSRGVPTTLRPNVSVWLSDHGRDDLNTLSIPSFGAEGSISQRPLTQVTRSSCVTTSDLSGISDFPAPPKNLLSEYVDPHSILNSYFDKFEPKGSRSLSRSSSLSRASSPPKKYLADERQVEFGGNQDADDLANYPFHAM